jgi:hypothetical protein
MTNCSANEGAGSNTAAILAQDNCTIVGSTANLGKGISAGKGCNIVNCAAQSGVGNGISVNMGSSVTNCTVTSSASDGILASSNCYLGHNTSSSNGGAGVRTTSGSCLEANTVISNNIGIQVDATVNLIFGNRARGNAGGNYSIVANNRVGLIVVPPFSGAISGNGPGSGFVATGTTDPFANLAYRSGQRSL